MLKLDTSKMTDKEADISSALQNLFDVCTRYNVTSFARIIFNKKRFVGAETHVVGNDQQKKENLEFLMETFNNYTVKITAGQVVLARIKPEEGE